MRRVVTWLSVVAVAILAACGDAGARAEPTGPNFSIAPSVGIQGPANVPPNQTCEWHGTISNGTAPYTWTWSRTGGTGRSDELSPTVQSYLARLTGGTIISLTITDAEGRTATASKSVGTSPSAPMCYP
jgi:hypothetical protein